MDAREGEEFILRDGTRLRNAKELFEALEHLSPEDWQHFVAKGKNDFARWIELSLDDRFLAARVRRSTTTERLRKELFMTVFR